MGFFTIFAVGYILFIFFYIRKFCKKTPDVFFSLQQKSDDDSNLFFESLENIEGIIYDLREQEK